MLSDLKGYNYNGILACNEPLKFDEHVGKIGAFCHELFASVDNPDGANYLDENRMVIKFSMLHYVKQCSYCVPDDR